jgi:CelD/BcsL family acetyltransferase involved in cellulose biosynthesis
LRAFGAEVVVASVDSDYAPQPALERMAVIASARRAALADRYPMNSFAVEWRWLADLVPVSREWRDLAAHALEPNVFYEPAFALAAGAVFGQDVGAVLVWSGEEPRKLLGFFPARVVGRRYGLPLPVLEAWTHPYAPLGTPLVAREAAEPVISAWLSYLAADTSRPGLLRLPLIVEDGHFAIALDAVLRRLQMPSADLARHSRPQLVPGDDRAAYLEQAVSAHRHRELRRSIRRLADLGALLFTAGGARETIDKEIEDFFALEAAGWKGAAGTAAARHDELRGFMKTAVRALGAEGKVAINRILLDGRAIAATITLKSGDGAWYWKTAYDEALARFAPGVLLSAALTEDLAENAAIAHTDSCAGPGNPILDNLWRERLHLCDRLIALRPRAPLQLARGLERLRGAAIGAAKAARQRLKHR